MFSYYCTTISVFLCFFIMGCSKPMISLKADLKAWDHMSRAAEMEKAGDYSCAAQEYSFVADHYPLTGYYQTAVRKAALLNIHPSNPKKDLNEALRWLRVYRTLPISSEEEEFVQSNIALVEKIEQLRVELSKACSEKDRIHAEHENLLSVTLKQSSKLEDSNRQIAELEKTLSHVQDQLDEMKKVDLQLFTEKANGQESSAVERGRKATGLFPEAYSPIVPTAGVTAANSNATMITKKIVVPQMQCQEKVSESAKENVEAGTARFYPYTIQVSSFFRKEDAIRMATEIRDKGDLSFTSPAVIPGKGPWYRVFIGHYESLNEAKSEGLEVKRQKYPQAFISRLPFVIQVEATYSDEGLEKIESELYSKGYLAYSIPGRKHNGDSGLLIGAFKTEKEAARQARDLKLEGFRQKVVRR